MGVVGFLMGFVHEQVWATERLVTVGLGGKLSLVHVGLMANQYDLAGLVVEIELPLKLNTSVQGRDVRVGAPP